ncbi:hypothetical protein ABIB26_002681 [Arthrobacter sp. UYEF20]
MLGESPVHTTLEMAALGGNGLVFEEYDFQRTPHRRQAPLPARREDS